jgi:UDP-N-acetylmuramoyl-tripeptide--D-alanyl-D-alanine ligase
MKFTLKPKKLHTSSFMSIFILTALSRAILKKYNPSIIAIAGSVGKTATKEACFFVLKEKFKVRKTEENFNTANVMPFAIIGVRQGLHPIARFFLAFLKAMWLIVIRSKRYPQILILEFGAESPGEISKFLTLVTPTVGILTAIDNERQENFQKFSQLISEKRKIIETLPRDGHAVLNFDEEISYGIAEKTNARVVSYGVNKKAVALKAEEQKVMTKDGKSGLYFKLLYKGTATPIFIKGYSERHIDSLLAASACGFIYELTPIEVARGLERVSDPSRFAQN